MLFAVVASGLWCAGAIEVRARDEAHGASELHAEHYPHKHTRVTGSSRKDFAQAELYNPLRPHSAVPDSGQPLARDVLARIDSVRCLRAKQQNPDADCAGRYEGEGLSISNFPSWRQPQCNGYGALLCDPEHLLSVEEQRTLAVKLRHFASRTILSCGYVDTLLSGRDSYTSKPFNLGMALIKNWPVGFADSATLRSLGQVIMSRWGMVPIYNGVNSGKPVNEVMSADEYTANCPNAALLIVIPELSIVYLASPSCEFICEERGASAVSDKVKRLIKEDGLAQALDKALEEVRLLLDHTTPQSVEDSRPHRWRGKSLQEALLHAPCFFLWVQRGLFFACIVGGLAMIFAFVSQNLLKAPEQRRYVRLRT